MELKDMILGYLDWKQLTGYELKGLFSDSDFLPWSGNNNQIYTALLELEKEGMVAKQVIPQEKLPPQKRYAVTPAGWHRLRAAVLREPDVTRVRNDFLLQLAWSECLTTKELMKRIEDYQLKTELELAMCREKAKRRDNSTARSEREKYIWGMMDQNRAAMLQAELNWLTALRNGLTKYEGGN